MAHVLCRHVRDNVLASDFGEVHRNFLGITEETWFFRCEIGDGPTVIFPNSDSEVTLDDSLLSSEVLPIVDVRSIRANCFQCLMLKRPLLVSASTEEKVLPVGPWSSPTFPCHEPDQSKRCQQLLQIQCSALVLVEDGRR